MVLTNENVDASGPVALETIWSEAKISLSRVLPPAIFQTWIERLRPVDGQDNTLTLEAPNHFFRNFIERSYGREIGAAVAQIGSTLGLSPDRIPAIDFCEAEDDPAHAASPDPGEGLFGDLEIESADEETVRLGWVDRGLSFDPRLTFETFVVGDPNSLAYHAAKAFSQGEALGAGILFITADPGLGKSHLAQALGQSVLGARERVRVMYLTFEDYTNEMVYNLNRKTMEDFKRKYRERCDLLLLEEAAFLKDKTQIQQELCYTLDNIINSGKRVVITSTKGLQSIPKMDQSLRSRLSSALLAHIGPPDFQTRLGILQKQAQAYATRFPRPVVEYIAQNVKTDVRQLQSCLYTLNANHALLGRPVTMAMAEEVVQGVAGDDGKLILNKVVKVVCRAYDLGEDELRSKNRRKALNEARSLGMYLAKTVTGHTLTEIGAAFGRNHSTTTYTITKTTKALATDQRLRLKLEYLIGELDKVQRKTP